MNKLKIISFLILLFLSVNAFGMSRTIKKDPALVLVAFGTTTKARAVFEFMEQQIRSEKEFKNLEIQWAFTSEVIRERANEAFKKQGSPTRYLSLLQTLANLEAEGYRKVVVQPLHIFPGQEYDEVTAAVEAFKTMGLRIEMGESLLHEWPMVHEVVEHIEKDFLPVSKGCNVIVSHGTPQTFQGANATYLGLERYLSEKYSHVFIGAVEGILTREGALARAKQCPQKQIRFISLMLVSGDHIMNDIMAPEPEDRELSWALEMKRAGFQTDIPMFKFKGKSYYKSLGFEKGVVKIFIHSMEDALKRVYSH